MHDEGTAYLALVLQERGQELDAGRLGMGGGSGNGEVEVLELTSTVGTCGNLVALIRELWCFGGKSNGKGGDLR